MGTTQYTKMHSEYENFGEPKTNYTKLIASVALNVVLFVGIVCVLSSGSADQQLGAGLAMRAPAVGARVLRTPGNQCLRVSGKNPFSRVAVSAIHAPMTAAATYKVTLQTPEGESVLNALMTPMSSIRLRRKDLIFHTLAVLELAPPALERLLLDPLTSLISLSLRTAKLLMDSFLPASHTLPPMLPSQPTKKRSSFKFVAKLYPHMCT